MYQGPTTRSQRLAAPTSPPAIPDIVVPSPAIDDDNGSEYRSPTPFDQFHAMASPSLPKDLFKVAQFRGDKSNDSSRALTFLQHMNVYFSLFDCFKLSEPNGLHLRLAAMRLNCFPHGSHAGIWFEQHYASDAFPDYATFESKFRDHFVATQSDLISMQTTWSNLKQRPGDTVESFFAHFCRIRSQLQALGHDVPEHDAILRFQKSVHAHIAEKLEERRLDNPNMDLNLLYNHARTFERHHRASRPNPRAAQNGVPKLNALNSNSKWCFFCRKNNHSAADCRKIAARKQAGTWEERPAKSAPKQ